MPHPPVTRCSSGSTDRSTRTGPDITRRADGALCRRDRKAGTTVDRVQCPWGFAARIGCPFAGLDFSRGLTTTWTTIRFQAQATAGFTGDCPSSRRASKASVNAKRSSPKGSSPGCSRIREASLPHTSSRDTREPARSVGQAPSTAPATTGDRRTCTHSTCSPHARTPPPEPNPCPATKRSRASITAGCGTTRRPPIGAAGTRHPAMSTPAIRQARCACDVPPGGIISFTRGGAHHRSHPTESFSQRTAAPRPRPGPGTVVPGRGTCSICRPESRRRIPRRRGAASEPV